MPFTKNILNPKNVFFSLTALVCALASQSAGAKIKKESVTYGKTKSGGELRAIRMYDPDHKLPMRPAVLVTGGIHGNEHMGLVGGIAEKVSGEDEGFKDFFAAGGVAYFIPEVNADGVKSRNRYNPSGIDLNRDFKMDRRPSQEETSQLLNFLESDFDAFHARPILAMDYHCCSKSLIYPEVAKDQTFYKGKFEKIVGLMKENVDPTYKSGLTKDIFGYETHGTLKGYWFKKYGALSFTYEGANPREENKKLEGHHNWWKKIMAEVVEVYDKNLAQLQPQQLKEQFSGESPVFYTE